MNREGDLTENKLASPPPHDPQVGTPPKKGNVDVNDSGAEILKLMQAAKGLKPFVTLCNSTSIRILELCGKVLPYVL